MYLRQVLNLLLLFLVCPSLSNAQGVDPVCGTESAYEARKKANPELRKAEERANKLAEQYKNQRNKREDGETVIIPVVVHVLHNGGDAKLDQERVKVAINRLNLDFQLANSDTSTVSEMYKDRIADFNYKFELVNKGPDGNCTNGITYNRTDLTDGDLWLNNLTQFTNEVPYWNPENYLNIWTVEEIFTTERTSVIAGQANFPWDQRGADGIIIRSDQLEKSDRTLTHEAGHYVGLFHPFQGGCSSDGDRVDDTPLVEDRDGIIPCDGRNTCGGDPDLLTNYMDYTECGAMFTQGQKVRAETYIQEPFRGQLVSESNLAKRGLRETNKPPKIKSVNSNKSFIYTCEKVKLNFDYAQECNNGELNFGTPDNIQWEFEGGNPMTSKSFNPVVSYDKPGTYKVSLKISNQFGQDEVVKTRLINVLGSEQILSNAFLKGLEEEDIGSLGIVNLPNQNNLEWKRTTKASAAGEASLFLDNFDTRNDQEVEFRLPLLDLSESRNPNLQFDIAYAYKNQNANDNLEVFYSTDCGSTWTLAKKFFNFMIKTSDNENEPFFPENESQWQTEEINLPSASKVLVRFKWTTSKGGNNAFMDNFRYNWNVGRETITPKKQGKKISIYPNPTSGPFKIVNNGERFEAQLRIVNSVGKQVYQKSNVTLKQSNDKSFTPNDLNLKSEGIYYVSLTNSQKTITQKIVLVP